MGKGAGLLVRPRHPALGRMINQVSGTHATFYRGKHVYVILRNGDAFDDHWASDHSRGGSHRVAEFKDHGKIPLREIRSITIYKGGNGNQSPVSSGT